MPGPVLALALLAMPPQSAVPPPAQQVTANCETPVYASDRVICSDEELLDIEHRIGALWAANGQRLAPDDGLEGQDAWFRRRALCAFQSRHRECLAAAGSERLAVLAAAASPPPTGADRALCRGVGAPRRLTVIRSRGDVVAYDGEALVWVARRADHDWTPFVTWVAGKTLTMRTATHRRWTCRIDP